MSIVVPLSNFKETVCPNLPTFGSYDHDSLGDGVGVLLRDGVGDGDVLSLS